MAAVQLHTGGSNKQRRPGTYLKASGQHGVDELLCAASSAEVMAHAVLVLAVQVAQLLRRLQGASAQAQGCSVLRGPRV